MWLDVFIFHSYNKPIISYFSLTEHVNYDSSEFLYIWMEEFAIVYIYIYLSGYLVIDYGEKIKAEFKFSQEQIQRQVTQ